MMKYKIEITEEEHSVPVVTFENEEYGLAGTFLLAEARTFGREILEALEAVTSGREKTGTFAGNVFSLEITPKTTTVCDDISGEECEIATADLQKIAGEYVTAYRNMKKR